MKYAHLAVKPSSKSAFELARAQYLQKNPLKRTMTKDEFLKVLLTDHFQIEKIRGAKNEGQK